jgi:hypothetical protein
MNRIFQDESYGQIENSYIAEGKKGAVEEQHNT